MNVFKNKTTRFLTTSLIAVVLLCVCVFSFLTVHMNYESTQTINQVGTLYMSNMSQQISMHFATTISLRLDQLDAMTTTLPSESVQDHDRLRQELSYQASVRNFDYLGLYSDDGSFEMLYGEQLAVTDPAPFLESLSKGEKKVAIGTNPAGDKVILLGISASYTMENGRSSIALVAGLPASYLSDTLSLEEDDDHVYSFILRRDGSFVIRNANAYRNGYFERVRTLYSDINGMDPERYLEELQQAMDAHEDYSTECIIGGDRRHVYLTALPYSEWYLLTTMPYSTMDSIVSGLSQQWARTAVLGGAVLLAALLVVFAQYFKLTRQQLEALEKAREEAEEATRAKSEFLSNMSHDIRTPMNAIVGFTTLAITHIERRDQVEEYLKKIMTSGNHLLSLINDILDMSRIESGKIHLDEELCSLPDILHSLHNIVQADIRAKQLDLFIDAVDVLDEDIYCDKLRLNQVLLNLLGNAIKYTGSGGTVSVRIIERRKNAPAGYANYEFHVKDTGIGMSKEFVSHIFEPFERERNSTISGIQGTGLGMAITKNIVDMMNGIIEVKSEQGVGSEFIVTFPMRLHSGEKVPQTIPRLTGCRALVVDDDFNTCDSVSYMLQQMGLRAEWTMSGREAVLRSRQAVDWGDCYSVYIIDWLMPDMNGIEVARRIRKETGEDVPIIVLTAYDWSDIEEEAREAGVSAFCSKPLFLSELRKCLCTVIADPSEEKEEPAKKPVQLHTGRILLAEDNELNQEIAVAILGDAGFTVEIAANGQIAVDMLERSEPGYYRLVLMDIQMPVMGGYEATKAIRSMSNRELASIPILAMTANAFEEDKKEALSCGMNGHIAKPIDVEKLIETLEKILN